MPSKACSLSPGPVSAYQRGAALRAHCERKLAEAEQKVQAIVEGPSGLALRDVE